MPTLNDVLAGSLAQAVQVQQIIDAMKGTASKGVPVSFSSLNDANNYAMTVKNLDPTNSRALSVLKSDGTTLITADATGVTLGGTLHLPAASITSGFLATGLTIVNPILQGPTVNSGVLTVTTLIQTKRLGFNQATNLSNSDFAISAGWGTAASLSASSFATDQQGAFTVTAGTSPSANPTVTLTFKDGAFPQAPHGMCQMSGGSGAGIAQFGINTSPTTTVCTFQMFFTPVNGTSYVFSYLLFGE